MCFQSGGDFIVFYLVDEMNHPDLGYMYCLAVLFLLALPAGECSAQSARRRNGDRPANLYRADMVIYHPVKGGRDSVRFDDGAKMTKAAAVKDLADFTEWMRKYYPGDIGSDARLEAVERAMPDTMGIYDFFNACRHYVYGFHDSHLSMKTVVSFHGVRQYAPNLDCGFFDGRLLVTRTARDSIRYLGLQVDSIDGIPAEEIRRIVESRAGNYDDNSQIVKSLSLAIMVCPILYDNDIFVPRRTRFALSEVDDPSRKYRCEDVWRECNNFTQRSLVPTYNAYFKTNKGYGSGNNHLFRYLNDSIAYLGISSFEFGDREIAEIRTQLQIASRLKVPDLIIDLRNNAGGFIPAMLGVLSEIFTDEPRDTHSYAFINDPCVDMPDYRMHIKEYRRLTSVQKDSLQNRFGISGDTTRYYLEGQYEFSHPSIDSLCYAGRVYVLVNPQTFSAAAVMAAIIKRNRRGVIVGTETPAAYSGGTGMYIFTYTMKNSGLRIDVPIARTVYEDRASIERNSLADDFPAGRGVMPDYPLELTRDILFETQAGFPGEGKHDAVMDFTLDLIRQGRYREIVPKVPNTAFSAILRRYAAVSESSSPIKGVLPKRLPVINR